KRAFAAAKLSRTRRRCDGCALRIERASIVASVLARILPTKRRAPSHRDFLLEPINFLEVSQSLAPAAKRVCSLCTKIICESSIVRPIGIKNRCTGEEVYVVSSQSCCRRFDVGSGGSHGHSRLCRRHH